MPPSKLSPLQLRVLEVLAGMEPRFVLTGGAALAGFHLGHRSTRDLDLFWRERSTLDRLVGEVRRRLVASGLAVEDLETALAFHRFRVSAGSEVTVVDLVADPTQTVAPPTVVRFGDLTLLVDSPHEILVNKLCTLLGRAELRDLEDVRALVEAGEDLGQALDEAPLKDGGFSPLTLAWLLQSLDVQLLGRSSGASLAETTKLQRFKEELIARLLRDTPGD